MYILHPILPSHPFLDGKNHSSCHLLKLGFKASQPIYAGPMLANLGSNLGPCWVILWFMWSSLERQGSQKKKQHKTFPLGGFCQTVLSLSKSHVGQLRVSHGLMSGNFGSNLGPHLATWAPAWAHVERFGGLCGAPWNSRGRKKKPNTQLFRWGFFSACFVAM